MNTSMTVAMILCLAAFAVADVSVDTVVPEADFAATEDFVEASATEQSLALPSLIEDFNSKAHKANADADAMLAQAKADLHEATAARKKDEWSAARYQANTRTITKAFPANQFPVLVESTFSQCVYKPDGFGEEPIKAPAAPQAKKAYSTHYRTLCAGEIATKAEKKAAIQEAGELKNKKCADTVEKSGKSAETTTKSFKKTQVNEGKTKQEAKAVKELQGKLEVAQKDSTKKSFAPAPAAPSTSPELCEKQGVAAESYEKHAEKLAKATEVTEKAGEAKEAAYKAKEAAKKNKMKYMEVAKKQEIEGANKKSEKDDKCAKKGDLKESEEKGAEKGGKGDVKEELEKAKHKEASTKDEAESQGKEKAKKSAEAVAKTAIYEKKIKKELTAKKGKHDLIKEMEEKAHELKAKHPKTPDFEEKLEKTKESAYKADSTHKEEDKKWELKSKKNQSDADEMKTKNELFAKVEKKTKAGEVTEKASCKESGVKSEAANKESSMKTGTTSQEGKAKVVEVEAGEQKTKEKHAKDPFYGLKKYAAKVEGMHEVFDKTKAAFERKCKTKEQELATKSFATLKGEEGKQEASNKEQAKKSREYEAKTEKATKEKVMKVQGAAENLEKATHERCDKTTASSESSDKWEVKKWSAELDSFKAQCASAKSHEEKDQKSFVVNVCEAAHDEMDSVAEDADDVVETPASEVTGYNKY